MSAPVAPIADPPERLREKLLLDHLRGLAQGRQGQAACLIRLSQLRPENRREQPMRAALASFDSIIKQRAGQIFPLSSGDLMIFFKESFADNVRVALLKLQFLFSADPAFAHDRPGGAATSIATWFSLEKDYRTLLPMAEALVNQVIAAQAEARNGRSSAVPNVVPRRKQRQALTPQLLAKLEVALTRADLSNMIRQQAVCAVVGDAMPQPIFHELFVSISELQETLLPDFDLGSSPWLFRELTETLDHRILILLTRHEGHRLAGDISINLNVQTVLAPEFLAFDDFVRARQGRTVVLELQKVDIFADLAAFQYARDFVRERGYRVCIDGVTADSLALIDRERFGVDLVKIPWSPVFTGASGDVNHQLADYVAKSGSSGVVLCHCDTASSIFVGQSAGISFFQGRHVDSLLDPGKTRSRSPVPR